MKKLLLAAALAVAAPSAANADSITVGWWDADTGGGVTQIFTRTRSASLRYQTWHSAPISMVCSVPY